MASSVYEEIMARVGYANVAHKAFARLMEEFWKANPIAGKSERDEANGQRHYYVENVPTMPMEPRLAFSGVITNLRAALDHVAYHLVLNANGGKVPPRTKVHFPIARSAAAYPDLRNGYLPGVHPDILLLVDGTEPYQGGKGHALWQLNELAKVDKHRLTIGATLSYGAMALPFPKEMVEFMRQNGAPDFEPPEIYIRPAVVGQPLQPGQRLLTEPIGDDEDKTPRKFRFEFFIQNPDFGNQKNVGQILDEIGKTADETIRLFEPFL